MKYISYSSSGSSGLLQKVAAGVAAVAMAVALLVFSSVILAVLAVIVVVGGIYMWWKTRHVRRAMREMQENVARARAAYDNGGDNAFRADPFGQASPRQGSYAQEERYEGVIIEGEAVHVEESPRQPRA